MNSLFHFAWYIYSGLIHIVACIRIFFSFNASNIPLCIVSVCVCACTHIYITLCTSFNDVCCLCRLAAVNNAVVGEDVQLSELVFQDLLDGMAILCLVLMTHHIIWTVER